MPSPVVRARRRRWTAVAAGTAAMVAVALFGLPSSGSTTGTSAQRLLARAAASASVAYSGTAAATGSLGLPDLPRLSGVAALLGQTTHTRVWWRSPDTYRVASLLSTGEDDVYTGSGRTTTWSYADDELAVGGATGAARLPAAQDLLPPQVARSVLAGPGGLAASGRGARLLGSRSVAGVRADGVRVVSSGAAAATTTLDHADLWVARGTGLPVRVDLVDRVGTTALSTAFDSLTLAAPDLADLAPPSPPSARVRRLSEDIATGADRFAPVRLPDTLAGLPADTAPDDRGVLAYGLGLTRLSVIPLRPNLGEEAVRAARAAGGPDIALGDASGAPLDDPAVQAVQLRAGAVTAAVLSSRRGAYLLGGSVPPAVVRAAVQQLVSDPPGRRNG